MHTLSLFDFCPELTEMISSRRVFGRSGKVFEGLAAVSSFNTLITLRNLYLSLEPRRSLEVGLCFGASALLFTGSYRASGRLPNRQHVALDPFQSSVWDDAGLCQVESAGLAPFLDFRSVYSRVELPRLLEEGAQFDLIYVDGSHLFEDVFVDAFYSCRLLAEGGVVAFDDCSDPHVGKVIRFLQRNCRDGLSELNLESYRAGRSFRYRFGRLLGRVQMRAFRSVGRSRSRLGRSFPQFLIAPQVRILLRRLASPAGQFKGTGRRLRLGGYEIRSQLDRRGRRFRWLGPDGYGQTRYASLGRAGCMPASVD